MPISEAIEAVKTWKSRNPAYRIYENYFDGRHQLKFVSPDWVTKYAQRVLTDRVLSIRENLCPAVVYGFTDPIAVDDWADNLDDDNATRLGLPRLLSFIKRECFKTGDAYVIAVNTSDGVKPVFQRARDMVPHIDPENPDQLDWAARVWVDKQTRHARVNIYWPDVIERYQTVQPLAENTSTSEISVNPQAWTLCPDEPTQLHNFGVVPVVWFKLDAQDQTSAGNSILADVIPLQDGLNTSLANLLINQEAYARTFWYVCNMRADTQAVNPFAPETKPLPQAAPPAKTMDRNRQSILAIDGAGPVGQFDPPDVTKLLAVQEAIKTKICAVVGLPPYLMQAQIGNVPSGAALRTLETRRLNRITAWQADAQPVMRGLKQLLGIGDSPVVWAPPAQLDELERWQVAQVQQSLGWALDDILAWLKISDVDGIATRAIQAKTANSAAMAQAFIDGRGAGNYSGHN